MSVQSGEVGHLIGEDDVLPLLPGVHQPVEAL